MTNFNLLKTEFIKLQDDFNIAKKKLVDLALENMLNSDFWKDTPNNYGLCFTTYIPQFNDGEPCEFTIGEYNEFIVGGQNSITEINDLLSEINYDLDNISNNYFYNGDKISFDKYYQNRPPRFKYDSQDDFDAAYSEFTLEYSMEYIDEYKLFSRVPRSEFKIDLTSLGEDFIYDMFGVGTSVIIFKDHTGKMSLSKNEYDCGY